MKAYFLPNCLNAPMADCPVVRPSAVSRSSSDTPNVNTSTRYVSRNVPPPYFAARYGKRHMFPRPTADAAAARMNAHLPDQDERAGVPVEDIDNLRCRSINARVPLRGRVRGSLDTGRRRTFTLGTAIRMHHYSGKTPPGDHVFAEGAVWDAGAIRNGPGLLQSRRDPRGA